MLCFFIMDTYPNFKESSAHLAGFQVMLYRLVWRVPPALLLSVQDCQLAFSSSFYFLLSSSDTYLVSFVFCSPLPSLQRHACWTGQKLFCSWPYLGSYWITNTRERVCCKYQQQCASYLIIRMKREMSNIMAWVLALKGKWLQCILGFLKIKSRFFFFLNRNVTCEKRSLWVMCLLCCLTAPPQRAVGGSQFLKHCWPNKCHMWGCSCAMTGAGYCRTWLAFWETKPLISEEYKRRLTNLGH